MYKGLVRFLFDDVRNPMVEPGVPFVAGDIVSSEFEIAVEGDEKSMLPPARVPQRRSIKTIKKPGQLTVQVKGTSPSLSAG